MVLVKEIRPLNGSLYYCMVDYTTNKNGDIINITKRICAPLNNTQSEIRGDKIVNVDTEELVDKETKEQKEDEIKDDNEATEDENMVDANEIRRQIMDELAQKQRTEKLEQELAETKNYVSSFDKTLDNKTRELGYKLDKIASNTIQKPRNDEPVDDILRKIKTKQGLTEHIPSKEDVDCPDCVKKDGHHHSLKRTDKGTLKCTGVNCNHEFILLPKAEKYDGVCKTCGASVNRSMEKCVNCGGTSARAI